LHSYLCLERITRKFKLQFVRIFNGHRVKRKTRVRQNTALSTTCRWSLRAQ